MRTDEELMAAFAGGEVGALGELFRRNHARMVDACVARGAPRCDAEDVVQETFVRLHVAARSYRVGEPVRPWLLTILHNVRRDGLRAIARRPHSEIDFDALASTTDTARPLEQRETVVLVRRALRALSPVLREVVEQHWLEDQDFDEVAAASGVASGTLRVRAHRARHALREVLVSMDPDQDRISA